MTMADWDTLARRISEKIATADLTLLAHLRLTRHLADTLGELDNVLRDAWPRLRPDTPSFHDVRGHLAAATNAIEVTISGVVDSEFRQRRTMDGMHERDPRLDPMPAHPVMRDACRLAQLTEQGISATLEPQALADGISSLMIALQMIAINIGEHTDAAADLLTASRRLATAYARLTKVAAITDTLHMVHGAA
jgi:hypothetical protein